MKFPFIPILLRGVFFLIMSRCWLWSRPFLHNWYDHMISLLYLLICWTILNALDFTAYIDFLMLNQTCIPRITAPHLTIMNNSLIHCWIQSTHVLLRIFASLFMICRFFILSIWFWGFGFWGTTVLITWIRKWSLLFYLLK